MRRYLRQENIKEVMYKSGRIIAWSSECYYFNEPKGKWENKKEIICYLYKVGSKWQPLNLGECNDGGKFTAVNQAVNQAKGFVDCCNEYGI